MRDVSPAIFTEDNRERTIYLPEVERLYFYKSPLEPRYGKEKRTVAGIADFYIEDAKEPCYFVRGASLAAGYSLEAHEPISPLGKAIRRLQWSHCRGGIVVVEKRSLETNMLFGQ
jgi:hypothetical protein